MKSRRKWISHGELKADLMKDPGFRREYKKLEPEFQIARQIIGARIKIATGKTIPKIRTLVFRSLVFAVPFFEM